ncbi:MAG TPA: hypothetical protein VLK25_01215 [Allosphingosinicella sp.]|nr:hypothetical protein [Allosphingosinicella sp.]
MTTDHAPRLWPNDEEIRAVGEGFLARTLPKSEWTHEAHISTTCWLILERADIHPERDLPDLIRRYNESVGGVNSDTEGYHETITQVFIRTLRRKLAEAEGQGLAERVNAVLLTPEGRREWPLWFYSRERLFSKEARLAWVEPDLAALPSAAATTRR